MLEKTIAAAKSCGIPRSRIFAFDVHGPSQHADVQSWSAFFQHGESDFVDCHEPDTTVAAYHTTSGTSGLPKAAMIPHSYLIHQADCRISDVTVDYNVCHSFLNSLGTVKVTHTGPSSHCSPANARLCDTHRPSKYPTRRSDIYYATIRPSRVYNCNRYIPGYGDLASTPASHRYTEISTRDKNGLAVSSPNMVRRSGSYL